VPVEHAPELLDRARVVDEEVGLAVADEHVGEDVADEVVDAVGPVPGDRVLRCPVGAGDTPCGPAYFVDEDLAHGAVVGHQLADERGAGH
jgi:hypothetical protein